MVAERRVIDLESIRDGADLADELAGHPDGIVVRQHGRTIGLLSPLPESERPFPQRSPGRTSGLPQSVFGALRGWLELVDDSTRQRDRDERLALDQERQVRLGIDRPSPGRSV